MRLKKWDLIFLLVGIVIVFVLFIAPPQTTPRIPLDEIHKELKDEKKCLECHGKGTSMPLPEKHPNKERCLLCHKRKS